jgi:hypothetical protein
MFRTELDRLIEQSPDIPMFILYDFKTNPEFKDVAKPEVLDVRPIEEYKMSKEEKVIEIVTSVVQKLKETKPEKTLIQQLAEKHSNGEFAPPPIRNQPKPFILPPPIQTNLPINQGPNVGNVGNVGNVLQNLTNNALKNIETNVENQPINVLNSINGVVNSLGETTINQVVDSGRKIMEEQKEKIQNELSNINSQGIVSNAKSRFQSLVKKTVTKEEIENTTKNVLNKVIKEETNNNQVIQDIEMGIVKTNEILENETNKLEETKK